ncbi:HNH endonuclease signature motif containing protein [Blastococcus sp. CCUG 61487]|uniref:HNH endonuclease signature motif containing protein n=1 Tax=Blastococcus sp. CCUG 61487 TaxID=1840703 RepID=UPI0010C00FFB|nr:HNH endonuclease signature motif containing protein [Blastococcus sp. CCUG 61487]TKJ28341.1 hypothetical protein A6V29_02775 [Blastococcus sp. CCUG 61487]
MFDTEVVLSMEEYADYLHACLETPFGDDYPDAALFVRDEQQRFLDSRIRLLTSGAAHLDDALAAAKQLSRSEARRVRALAAFARSRPAAMFDRAPGERGAASEASRAARPDALTEVSEWAVDEAAATLKVSARTASQMLVDAVTLAEGLPATLAALEAGDISPAHARVMVEVAGQVADPAKRAEIEAAVLPRASRQTTAALRASVRRAVARIDAAAAADRLAKAVRDRHVRLDARDDGMSTLATLLSTPVGRACREALSQYAKACAFDEAGNPDPRTHEQRMADCLADLILRPHADHPVVRVVLTLVAGVDTVTGDGPGADEPGELEGDLVSAAQVRELVRQFGLLPRRKPAGAADRAASGSAERETAEADSATAGSGSPTADRTAEDRAAEDEHEARLAALRDEELAAADELLTALAAARGRPSGTDDAEAATTRAALTRLLDTRRLIDTALAERPRIAVVDQLTGSLLALTDSTELRAAAAAGRGLGPPGATDAYRPTDPLHRFVRLRDRRCRFPGCRLRARCCDLDHQVPHPHGETAHDNLACLCEHHHRLSHQAPGWSLHRNPDGGLVWTLPSGLTITTYPPAFGTDDGDTRAQAPPRRTGRQRYEDALATLASSRPVPRTPDIPF